MATTQEIRQQIETAKQSAQEQRELVQQKRQEAKKAEEFYSKEEKKIPRPTVRLLRQGMFAGLEGRKRLQLVKKAEKEIGSRKKEIGVFKEGLTKYEKEKIEPLEAEIGRSEAELKAYEKEQASIKLAEKVAAGGSVFLMMDDPVARKYYRLIHQGKKVEQQVYGGRTEELSLGAPKVSGFFYPKGTYDIKTGTYTSPSGVKQSMALDIAKSKGASILLIPSPSLIIPNLVPPRDLPRTDIVRDYQLLGSVQTPTTSPFDFSFRTTGSPIRVTKITSPKSRGYIPSIRKQVTQKPKVYSPIKKSEPKKKKKGIFDSDEDFLFKKKSKKRKSFWGI
jgi:hypothetical protein